MKYVHDFVVFVIVWYYYQFKVYSGDVFADIVQGYVDGQFCRQYV